MANASATDDRASYARNTAIRELDLMRQAIDGKQWKEALFHKKLANAAIDEMIFKRKMTERKNRNYTPHKLPS